MVRVSIVVIAICTFFFNATIHAEPIDFYKIDGVVYDSEITTPDAFFGYGLGEKPVRHDILVGYLRSIARQSPRIQSETIGYTHEGRPILSFVISSPDNIKNIDQIKENHIARVNGGTVEEGAPVVVWLNYGVHGAESAGMDASIPTLYHLAAAQGEDIENTLKNTVIVMIAIFNPDGHSRRVNHVYTFSGVTPVTDTNHQSHNLWIEARTNHYWFDLNRDWLLLTQPESQSWIKVWHDWKPNVSADFHEMGSDSSYYFHPGEQKRKNPLVPDQSRVLLSSIAQEHADWLDKQGELYTSEEGFDNFYIGKGSTYPGVNGSVGILFEAAAARGGEIDTVNGVRTYAQNINIHFNTSLTTIKGALKNRNELLSYQREFFIRAERAARADDVKAYVLTTNGDPSRLSDFGTLLHRHDIDVYELARDLVLDEKKYTASESLIVPMTQAQYTLLKGIFDRVTEFEEAIFYDVSGWTLPLAYDLDYTTLDSFRFNQGLLGAPFKREKAIEAAIPGQASYGYLFSWNHYYAPRALYRFIKAGARPRVLMTPKTLTINGKNKTFDRGAIFIPANTLQDNGSPQSLHQAAIAAAREDFIQISSLSSGNVIAGSGDLGSRGSVRTLTAPSVLLLFDNGATRYGAGQLWHLLDKKMHMPVTLRHVNDLAQIDTAGYTHILIPGGGRPLTEAATAKIKKWINTGGTLIATKSAALWAQENILSSDSVSANDTPPAAPLEPNRYDYFDKTRLDAEHLVAGSLFESDLDISHPIGFGYADRSVTTMRALTQTLKTPTDPYATVARYISEPLISGYASTLRENKIAQTPMLTANRQGQGSIILFADDPSFRATFLGTDKLVMNSIFFSNLFTRNRAPQE